MPRQRTHYSRRTYIFPDDFPQRLERFRDESGLPWAEIARRLGTDPETVRRWKDRRVRPNHHHWKALVDLANSQGLGHLLWIYGDIEPGWAQDHQLTTDCSPSQGLLPLQQNPR